MRTKKNLTDLLLLLQPLGHQPFWILAKGRKRRWMVYLNPGTTWGRRVNLGYIFQVDAGLTRLLLTTFNHFSDCLYKCGGHAEALVSLSLGIGKGMNVERERERSMISKNKSTQTRQTRNRYAGRRSRAKLWKRPSSSRNAKVTWFIIRTSRLNSSSWGVDSERWVGLEYSPHSRETRIRIICAIMASCTPTKACFDERVQGISIHDNWIDRDGSKNTNIYPPP